VEDAFTITEVAAFSGVEERQVRNELEQSVLAADRDLRLEFAAVVYLRLLREARLEARELGPTLRLDIFKNLLRAMSERPRPREIQPRQFMRFQISEVFKETENLVARFRRWSAKLVRDENVKGGEPTFPKSRLTIRQVGSMLLRPDTEDARRELREDYPFLTDEDLEFAPIFVKAYPRVGRPTSS
jgi:hypothetical protein